MPHARAAGAETPRLEVRRTIRAGVAALWRAWTMQHSIAEWFSTSGARVTKVDVEPRTGGALRIACKVGKKSWRLDGEFLEVVPERRLRFTWVTTDCPASAGSVVTVDFLARGPATEIVVVQERFPSAKQRGENEQGWTELLGQVEGLIAAQHTLKAEVRRTIQASPEAAFRAWTTPELLARILTPGGFTPTRVERLEPRVGGRFRVWMIGGDREWLHEGEYLEVDAPRRLRFTWVSDWSPAELGATVTITLTPRGKATDLVLVHERHLDRWCRDDHEHGWGELIGGLMTLAKIGFAIHGTVQAARAMKETKRR